MAYVVKVEGWWGWAIQLHEGCVVVGVEGLSDRLVCWGDR